jgi:hypothetical protein
MAIKNRHMSDEEMREYMLERQAAQEKRIDPHSEERQQARLSGVQNHKYNPHRWRG